MSLTFSDYQKLSEETRIYPDEVSITYPALGLSGEVGECSELVKKALRDENGHFSQERREKIFKELGDVMWYLAALSADLGFDLGDIAQGNLDKLMSRKERGVLSGSGDNR